MALRTRLRAFALRALLGDNTRALTTRWHRSLGPGERLLEIYFRIDDPYSHLLAQLLPAFAERHDLTLEFILVGTPPGDTRAVTAPLTQYAIRDAKELALQYTLEFPADARAPTPDQVAIANRVLAVERDPIKQLRIARLLGTALFEHDGEGIRAVTNEHDAVDAIIATRRLARHQRLLERRGHYQGGMLRYLGQWYWGIDRLAHLERRLRGGPLASQVLRRRGDVPPLDKSGSFEFFFSFRSPYSYLAIDRVHTLCDKHGLALKIRPVLPMVMRGLPVPFAKRLYIARDCKREAERLGLPFGYICDPLGPGIGRAMALFHYAQERHVELDFIRSAARGSWSEGLDLACDEDMKRIATRAGLDWSEASERLDDSGWEEPVQRNREALTDLGLWGVPSFAIGHYSAWGQDRIAWIDERLSANA